MAKKAEQNQGYRTFKTELSGGTIRPLYLFWGEEDYLREYYLGKLREACLAGGLEEFNYFRLDGKAADAVSISEAVEALPVFAERKFVEVRDFDFYKAAASERDGIDVLLADLPDYCCLVFVFSDPAFKPDGRMKIHRHFKEAGLSVEFGKQEQSDLLAWIRRRCQALDKDIDRQTSEYLIFLCGSLMTGLAGEIEKIAAYAKGETITRGDIDAVGTPVLDAVVWRFTDALGERNLDGAASIMGELLLMRESPILILAATGKKLRQLLSARLAMDSGRGEARYLQKLWGMGHEYPAKLLLGAARRFSLDWCKEAVLSAAKADLEMKSTGRGGEEILTEFLIALSMRDLTMGQGRQYG